MNVGEQVRCINSADSRKISNGLVYTIDETRLDCGALELHFKELAGRNWYRANRFAQVDSNKNTNATQTGGNTMNNVIRRVFAQDSLEVAEKVNQHFGHEIVDNFTGELNLRTNKDKYLAEITKREQAQADNAHKALGGDVATAIAEMAGKLSK